MSARSASIAWTIVAVVSGVAILAWFQTEDRVHVEHTSETELPLVVRLAPSEIFAFEVDDRTHTARFERDASGVFGVSGAERALATLLRARVERRFPRDAETVRRFGLDQPALTVTLHRVIALNALTLTFGDRSPDGFSRYVTVDGSPEIITIPDYHRENLEDLLHGDGSRP